jgi:hypothetical protein
MPSLLYWLLFGVVVLWVLFTLRRAFASRRLLVIDVERGRITRARGRAPGELLADLADVAKRASLTGRIEVRIDGDRGALHVSGEIDEAAQQRLRNVVGRFPLAKLRAGRPVAPGG